jgi:hypothetical protein
MSTEGNRPSEPGAASPGQRACTKITLVATVIHDGDPDLLGHHLALEVDDLVEAWGNDLAELTDVAGIEVVEQGDASSPSRPVIRAGAERQPTARGWRVAEVEHELAQLQAEVAGLRQRVQALEAAGGES